MAYVDRSKNRALWEIRLGQLRRERAAREAGGQGTLKEQDSVQKTGAVRIPISYEELLKREAAESGKRREMGNRERSREKTGEKTRVQEQLKERQAQI